MSTITIDYEKVKKAVDSLQSSPPSKDDVMKDPKGFLARYGVEIDDGMQDLIKSHLKGLGGTQAAIIHVDGG